MRYDFFSHVLVHHVSVIGMHNIQPALNATDVIPVNSENSIQDFRGFPIVSNEISFIRTNGCRTLRLFEKEFSFLQCIFGLLSLADIAHDGGDMTLISLSITVAEDDLRDGNLQSIAIEKGGLPFPRPFPDCCGDPFFHDQFRCPLRMNLRDENIRDRLLSDPGQLPSCAVQIDNLPLRGCHAHHVGGCLQDRYEAVTLCLTPGKLFCHGIERLSKVPQFPPHYKIGNPDMQFSGSKTPRGILQHPETVHD